uniref:Uncharacterized protein n=1 Tax=Ascaris lumbricoides TaxID=6252 RepID=A0A0M3IJI2_ASCLU
MFFFKKQSDGKLFIYGYKPSKGHAMLRRKSLHTILHSSRLSTSTRQLRLRVCVCLAHTPCPLALTPISGAQATARGNSSARPLAIDYRCHWSAGACGSRFSRLYF